MYIHIYIYIYIHIHNTSNTNDNNNNTYIITKILLILPHRGQSAGQDLWPCPEMCFCIIWIVYVSLLLFALNPRSLDLGCAAGGKYYTYEYSG